MRPILIALWEILIVSLLRIEVVKYEVEKTGH